MKNRIAIFATLACCFLAAAPCVFAADPGAEPNLADSSKFGQVISGSATLRLSSADQEKDKPEHHLQLFTGPIINNAFTTDAEKNPWVIISLGAEKTITGIDILNAKQNEDAQATPATMQLSISKDGKDWTKVWESSESKKEWKISLLKGFFPQYHARYLKLELLPDDKTKFSLSRITVYGS